ncbi:hypothetical protein [Lentisalinibacter salinarum]|uniref:hypothetical protein n=1 Tax=Lentisalinibacter salinarum TaxID=2992239 RepID=UPI003869A672
MNLWEFLKNPSVAAFVGAMSAFGLVAINDWRRQRRKARQIAYLIADNQEHARRKREAVREVMELLRKEHQGVVTPIMKFQTATIRACQQDVNDRLTANQNQALSMLVFWMEGIDAILDDSHSAMRTLRTLAMDGASAADQTRIFQKLLQQLSDAESNLAQLTELMQHYVDGEPHKIVEYQYPLTHED